MVLVPARIDVFLVKNGCIVAFVDQTSGGAVIDDAGFEMASWLNVDAALQGAPSHRKVLNGLDKELAGRVSELVVVGVIRTVGSPPRNFAMALTPESIVHFQQLPMKMTVGQSVTRDHPHVVQPQALPDRNVGMVIFGCGDAVWEMDADAAQALFVALTGDAGVSVVDSAVVPESQSGTPADEVAFKRRVRSVRKRILLGTVAVFGLLFAVSALTNCSGENIQEQALRSCVASDVAAELTGDITYASVRPEDPTWPSLDELNVTVYDTGWYELAGTVDGVPWVCLWNEKEPLAKVSWGE